MTKGELIRFLEPFVDEIEIKIREEEFSPTYSCDFSTGVGCVKLIPYCK
ncbi:hypothetical protein LCGC14_2381370 [marine sediment metagenome]|uniref:Uncharacterized protein n=1 Tax=marine sediment metagenome TaxID=412755 RepID=A0A0F9CN12_9ZZZZ